MKGDVHPLIAKKNGMITSRNPVMMGVYMMRHRHTDQSYTHGIHRTAHTLDPALRCEHPPKAVVQCKGTTTAFSSLRSSFCVTCLLLFCTSNFARHLFSPVDNWQEMRCTVHQNTESFGAVGFFEGTTSFVIIFVVSHVVFTSLQELYWVFPHQLE